MSTLRLIVSAVVCFFCHLGTVSAQSAPQTPEADLAQLRTGIIEAFNRRDIEGMLTFLTVDAVITWQNGEVTRGAQEIRSYYNRMIVGPDSVIVEAKANPEIQGRLIWNDGAFSYGTMHDEFKLRDGTVLPFNSRYSAVLARAEAGWKISALHLSTNVFENPVLRTAVEKSILITSVLAVIVGLGLGILGGRMLWRRRSA